MALRLYMDQYVPRTITIQLRLRGVDVLTAFEDGTSTLTDPALLDRATELGRVLFTRDDDLLTEAAQRQHSGQVFYGVVYAHQRRVSIGECVHDLEVLAAAVRLMMSSDTSSFCHCSEPCYQRSATDFD